MATLYQRLLGPKFAELHSVLQRFHSSTTSIRATGKMRVVRSPGFFRGCLATIMGLPATSNDVPLTLEVTPTDSDETWTRIFGGRPLVTRQWMSNRLLVEKAGAICFGIALDVAEGGMTFRTKRVWFLGIPLPGALAPNVSADVSPMTDGWNVVVKLRQPGFGQVLEYQGDITPQWTSLSAYS